MKILLEDITNSIPVSWDDDKGRMSSSNLASRANYAIIVRPVNNATGYEVVTGAKKCEPRLLGWTGWMLKSRSLPFLEPK
jgi:hypothetical protein